MKQGDMVWIVAGGVALLAALAFSSVIFIAAAFLGIGGGSASGSTITSGSVDTVDSINGLKIPYADTKLGHEGHLDDVHPEHCHGPDADPLVFAGGPGAYPPHTSEQERWYFNEYWPSASFAHKKLLVTSKQTKKQVVVSIEEVGPAAFVTTRDGIGAGAPPEVGHALGFSSLDAGYDGNPQSDNNRITVQFVKDQANTPLGPVGKNIQGCNPV